MTKLLDCVAALCTGRRPAGGRHGRRWLSREAIASRRKRRLLERKWKSFGSEEDRLEYRRSNSRTTNRLITESRHQANLIKFNKSVGNTRRQWRVVNYLLHTKPEQETATSEENQSLCDSFETFFVEKMSKIDSSIRPRLIGRTLSV